MSNEQPLALATPAITKINDIQYTSQPCLNQVPVYSNIMTHIQPQMQQLSKSQSFVNDLEKTETITTTPKKNNKDNNDIIMLKSNIDDLHLDPVVIRDNHLINNVIDKRKMLDNDLTLQDKENILLSASRLRLLQDTTMIESALDLDSLDDASIGNNSQADLMKL